MFFKLRSVVIFRNYKTFGYLTDNRNFGYLKEEKENHIGDKIISESGSIFISVLGKRSQSLDSLVKKIKKHFTNVDDKTIKNDALEFYRTLETDGFIVSGDTLQKCDDKDTKFSYKKLVNSDISNEYSFPAIIHHEKYTQDFLEEFFKGKPQLTNLHIEITSRCNERCLHCYIPHENKTQNIDPELFYKVLKQCFDLKLLHITLSGGEPMLHKSFCGFLKKCRQFGFSVNVLSNLTLLNEEIVKEMKANPLLGVQVSLYSMNPDIHDEITQMKGSLVKTKNAILTLVENDIPLQISCPIMKLNKNCYKDVIKWAKKYNINVGEDYVIIARYNHSKLNLNCRLSVNEIKEVINDKILNDSNYIEQMAKEMEKKKSMTTDDYVCSVCHSSVCIAENGNVYPCAGWQDYIIGNVKETSLYDIWNHSEKVQYLRNLRNRDFPKCIQCSDKVFCTLCLVRNANEYTQGNPLVVNDYFCKVAKLNKKIMFESRRKQMNK